MVLYKYLHPDRAHDLLQSRRIRFTQPDCFNDPFESSPVFDSVVERSLIEQVCEFEDPEETAKWRAQVSELFSSPEMKAWNVSKTSNNVTLLCLTATPDNILMWAHYADSHRGFVIGLDVEHLSLAERKDGGTRNLQKVRYAIDRPGRETLHEMPADELFYRKSPDWEYEAEWRMFDSAFNADEQLRTETGIVHLYDFHPDAVLEIIVGARMSDNPLETLLGALKDPDYKHVRLLRAQLHPTEYRVEIREMPPG